MWNKLKRKLKKMQGETLVESLVSILIGALSIALLVSCVVASSQINATNREADEKFNQDLLRAEAGLESQEYEAVEAVVEIDFSNVADETIPVTVYGGTDSSFVAYEQETEEENP